MTFATDTNTKQALAAFQKFDPDTQLALLWYGYLDIKDQLRPNTNPSVQDVGSAVFDQIKAMPKQQQLQAQRDIITGAANDISRQYSALSSSGKLDVWLRLAQGMEKGEIIQVPSNYNLPSATENFTNMVKGLDFEQRINFMRSAVVEMGSNAMQ